MYVLAKGLQALGWTVAVASGGQEKEHSFGPERFEAEGISHFYVSFLGFSNRNQPLDALRAVHKLWHVVSEFRPHIIHVQWRSTGPYAKLLHLLRAVSFVSTLHLEGIPASPVKRLFSFWGRRAIAISTETKQDLIHTFGLSQERVRLIYNGVDTEYFRKPTASERAEARAHYSLKPEHLVLCSIGRLAYVKGHDLLLDALSQLSNPNIKTLIAGTGELKQTLIQKTKDLQLENTVQFLGHTDSRRVLWAADICVMPSRQEGFGLVTAEAMLCGVVNIRSLTGGTLDLLDPGKTGVVISKEDSHAIADAVRQLCDNALRNRLADNAHTKALNTFSAMKMAKDTAHVYADVLKEKGT